MCNYPLFFCMGWASRVYFWGGEGSFRRGHIIYPLMGHGLLPLGVMMRHFVEKSVVSA